MYRPCTCRSLMARAIGIESSSKTLTLITERVGQACQSAVWQFRAVAFICELKKRCVWTLHNNNQLHFKNTGLGCCMYMCRYITWNLSMVVTCGLTYVMTYAVIKFFTYSHFCFYVYSVYVLNYWHLIVMFTVRYFWRIFRTIWLTVAFCFIHTIIIHFSSLIIIPAFENIIYVRCTYS